MCVPLVAVAVQVHAYPLLSLPLMWWMSLNRRKPILWPILVQPPPRRRQPRLCSDGRLDPLVQKSPCERGRCEPCASNTRDALLRRCCASTCPDTLGHTLLWRRTRRPSEMYVCVHAAEYPSPGPSLLLDVAICLHAPVHATMPGQCMLDVTLVMAAVCFPELTWQHLDPHAWTALAHKGDANRPLYLYASGVSTGCGEVSRHSASAALHAWSSREKRL